MNICYNVLNILKQHACLCLMFLDISGYKVIRTMQVNVI